jgi:SAM-dependent methyltransferase
MNWKQKALVQNLVAALPTGLGYAVYYRIQRRFGGLRKPRPEKRLAAGVRIAEHVRARGGTVRGKTVLEVGTGRALAMPLALWLCGAERVRTVDLNPYLRPELVLEDVAYMGRNRGAIRRLFGRYARTPLFEDRFGRLVGETADPAGLMEMAGIEYAAPADAAALDLPDRSIDLHVSFTVLEHIPPEVLRAIFAEAGRVLKPDGLLVHFADFTDHFSHADGSISSINFLQFDGPRWQGYAGNRFMYHNRLRIDDLLALFREERLAPVHVEAETDARALEALHAGFPLDERFARKSPRTNATATAWIVASPPDAAVPPALPNAAVPAAKRLAAVGTTAKP